MGLIEEEFLVPQISFIAAHFIELNFFFYFSER